MIDKNTRIIDLTVGELINLINGNNQRPEQEPPQQKRYVYGIAGIAQLLNCSTATANRIKSSGKIDRAISQSGRTITVDADLALELIRKK